MPVCCSAGNGDNGSRCFALGHVASLLRFGNEYYLADDLRKQLGPVPRRIITIHYHFRAA